MAVVKLSYSSVMLYQCLFVVFGSAERQLPKSCEENDLMNKRTLHGLYFCTCGIGDEVYLY